MYVSSMISRETKAIANEVVKKDRKSCMHVLYLTLLQKSQQLANKQNK